MKPANIIGHKTQRFLLERLYWKDRIPHALLFTGPSGIGKRQVAYELINSIYCLNNKTGYLACRKCKNCHLFSSSNIPDFREIDCLERSYVNAESIREILYSLNLNSFLSGKKVIIFNNAEFLPLQSSNILLKSLEEPGIDTHFILIAANPYRLPQTLLSRCQTLNFNPLSADELEQIFRSLKDNQEFSEYLKKITSYNLTANELSKYSQGSFENLLSITENIEIWISLKELAILAGQGDISSALTLSEKLSKDKDNLRTNLKFLSGIIRGLMFSSINNSEYERFAACLSGLSISEKLIFERNLSASGVLNFILVTLAGKDFLSSPDYLDQTVNLLSRT